MWFDHYPTLWESHKNGDPMMGSEMLGDELANRLGLPMCTLSPDQSKFFKRHYNNDKYNEGPLVKEMDVIRRIEGW
jgi:hypothetical protein